MNAETITDQNTVIAKYLGVLTKENNVLFNDVLYRIEDAKYSKSFDWLMPVIEKIAKTKNVHYASWCDGLVFVHRFETYDGGILSQGVSVNNIDAAFNAVVFYIEENEN